MVLEKKKGEHMKSSQTFHSLYPSHALAKEIFLTMIFPTLIFSSLYLHVVSDRVPCQPQIAISMQISPNQMKFKIYFLIPTGDFISVL